MVPLKRFKIISKATSQHTKSIILSSLTFVFMIFKENMHLNIYTVELVQSDT